MDLDPLDPAPLGPAPRGLYSPMDRDPALLAERLAASVRETMASTSTSCGSWASSSATRRVSVHVPWGKARNGKGEFEVSLQKKLRVSVHEPWGGWRGTGRAGEITPPQRAPPQLRPEACIARNEWRGLD